MRPEALRKEWRELAKKYAVIVVDTPPSISEAVEVLAPLVTNIVVPVTPAGGELDALRTTLALLPRERVRLVLNRCDAGRGARVVRRVLEGYGLPLSVVRDYVAFRDASLGGGTVFERYPAGNAAEDARRLAREVFS
jgi:cellulose biosynthesis protein BcsQ